MSYTRIYPTDHEAWLSLRGTGIGSSDVGTILGVNPYCTPYQLWLRKLGKMPPVKENNDMMLGHALEPVVADLYAKATGNAIQKDTEGDWCAKSDKADFLIASPDRICTSAVDGSDILLECKTTRNTISQIPDYWMCQVQYLLYITELEKGALAWLTNGHDFGYIDIVRNDKFCEKVVEKVERFWRDNIIGGKEPKAINADDIMLMFPKSEKGKIAQASDDMRDDYDRLNELHRQIDALTKEQTAIIDKMKMQTADAEKLAYGDKILGAFRGGIAKTTTEFDLQRFEAENPDLYAKYCSQVESVSKRSFYPSYTK